MSTLVGTYCPMHAVHVVIPIMYMKIRARQTTCCTISPPPLITSWEVARYCSCLHTVWDTAMQCFSYTRSYLSIVILYNNTCTCSPIMQAHNIHSIWHHVHVRTCTHPKSSQDLIPNVCGSCGNLNYVHVQLDKPHAGLFLHPHWQHTNLPGAICTIHIRWEVTGYCSVTAQLHSQVCLLNAYLTTVFPQNLTAARFHFIVLFGVVYMRVALIIIFAYITLLECYSAVCMKVQYSCHHLLLYGQTC